MLDIADALVYNKARATSLEKEKSAENKGFVKMKDGQLVAPR